MFAITILSSDVFTCFGAAGDIRNSIQEPIMGGSPAIKNAILYVPSKPRRKPVINTKWLENNYCKMTNINKCASVFVCACMCACMNFSMSPFICLSAYMRIYVDKFICIVVSII